MCTLADRDLAAELSQAPGVSLAGPLMTANLGITRLIRAVLDRPWIRVLLVCGTDSPLFGAGDSLIALARNGVSEADQRIIGARGYVPVLFGLTWAEVEAFRRQVDAVDLRGERDPDRLRAQTATRARRVGCGTAASRSGACPPPPRRREQDFVSLRPGGRRQPVASADEGFFVICIDRASHQIIVEHYWPDYRPGHQMRGVRAESMLLGLIGAGLAGCLSHVGYLGMELAKAETALRLGLDYEQDKPVRSGARRRPRRRMTVPTPSSIDEFVSYLAAAIGAQDTEFDPELPLAHQAISDSVTMVELAIVLEQELGVDLPEDLDLRDASFASLYARYEGARDA